MRKFIETCLTYYRTVLMILGLCLIWGTAAYLSIPKESNPDIKIPMIYISVFHEGISPNDAERLIVKPLEDEVRDIDGVKSLKSYAFEGGASVILEFQAGFDNSKARRDVIEKVNLAKANLPKDTKEPTIHEINMALMPILLIKLSSTGRLQDLYDVADKLKDEIEKDVPDVQSASIIGKQEEILEVNIAPSTLELLNTNLNDVINSVRLNHQLISAGTMYLESGEFSITLQGLITDYHILQNMPVTTHGDRAVLFKDIATISKNYKHPTLLAFDRVSYDKSAPMISIEITKRLGTNLIKTVERVLNVVESFKKTLPPSITISTAQDQSTNIKDMLLELQNTIILSIILVMGVIIWSLGWRSAILVGIAVPGSFLMGIMCLSFLGYNVNIVVLFSLIFSIGMLVDGAIIVAEYAERLVNYEKMSFGESYKEAAKRMAWPVITSIVTILVVFLPLLFWPGFVGQFMKYMPITLIAVLSGSILMALIFIPAITLLFKNIKKAPHYEQPLGEDTAIAIGYKNLIEKALAQPKRILWGTLAILVATQVVYIKYGKGVEFFPNVEPDNAVIYIRARGNLSIIEKTQLVQSVEKKVLPFKELKSVYTKVGNITQGDHEATADTIGVITFEFIHWEDRRSAFKILDLIEKKVKDTPGVIVEVIRPKSGPPSLKPIQVLIEGAHPVNTRNAYEALEAFMNTQSALINISNNQSPPEIEWQLTVDRTQAAILGVPLTMLGSMVQMLTQGVKVASYRPDGARDEIDILLRYPKESRTLEHLKTLKIPSKDGAITVEPLIKMTPKLKVGKIERRDQRRVYSVSCDVRSGVLVDDAVTMIRSWINKQDFHGVNITFKGEDEEQAETGAFLMNAFMVAIFLVAVILVTQFNSYFYMFVILSAVIMSTIGVNIGLLIHNQAFGIVMGGIGVIALAGIIVSNNIILLDTYNVLKRGLLASGKPLNDQNIKAIIVETCRQRLRPVILTKMATILGLLPIMFGINIDFINFHIAVGAPSNAWWFQLSTCIIYGVLFASSLTLFFTPCALYVRENKLLKKASGHA